MPLLKGSSRQVIGENISEARRSGYPEAQAVAMSLNQARKSGAKIPKKKGNPGKGKNHPKKGERGKKHPPMQKRMSGQKKNANEAEKQTS